MIFLIMYGAIIFLTFLFSFKSILFENLFNNYFLFMYHSFELAILSLQSTISYNNKIYEQTYLRWLFIGWIDYDYESNIIEKIDNFFTSSISVNSYTIIISWLCSYVLYQIYYIIKERIKKNRLDKWSFLSYNIKYFIINYSFLYLWNLNILLELININFIILFCNFLIFNIITFWMPGIIFNYIYGERMYLYRDKFKFLIDQYNPKYKYFTIFLLFLKALNGIYIVLYKYREDYAKYILLINLWVYSIICYYVKIFQLNKIKIFLLLQNILSLFIIFFSIMDIYFYDNIVLFIFQILLVFINIVYYIYTARLLNKDNNMDIINNPVFENIELRVIH